MFLRLQAVAALSILSLSTAALASTFNGCYSSPGDLTFNSHDTYMSYSLCATACGSSQVAGLFNGGDCYCGDSLPPLSAKTSDSTCSTPCFGFGQQTCGGPSAYTVLVLSGTPTNAGGDTSSAAASSASPSAVPAPASTPASSAAPVVHTSATPAPSAKSSTSPTSAAPSDPKPSVVSSLIIVTSAGNAVTQTVVQTIAAPAQTQSAPSPTASTDQSNGNGISPGAIAAAVIVSVLGVAGIIAAVIFFLKWRKGRDEMSAHRRIQSTNAFGPPITNDSRLDPSMVERRTSNGSIFADNEDYSRRILRVANA